MCLIVTLTLLFPTCLCVSLLRWPFYFQHAYVSHCYVDPFISNMPMCLIVTLTLLFPTCLCVSLAGAATSIIFVATEVYIYMLAATNLLLWQNYVCCDKTFVATIFFCPDKHMFVTTSILLSWQRMCAFVATNSCLSLMFCHNKNTSVQQNFRRNKHTFVVIKMILWLLQPVICTSPQNKIKNSSWESAQVTW